MILSYYAPKAVKGKGKELLERQTVTRTRKNNSADRVFNDLKDKIEKKSFVPGDRLPSENDLAEEYGVSRLTVRTALHKLSALGFLETQNGGGTYVIHFQFSDLIQSVSGMMLHNISHDDFCLYRDLIEVAAINLLRTRKILSCQIKELKTYCNRMKKYASETEIENFASADYAFHLALCKMSGNGMFVYAYELIKPLFLEYFNVHYTIEEYKKNTKNTLQTDGEYFSQAVSLHEKIIDCLETKDFDECIRVIKAVSYSSIYESMLE